MPESLKQGPKKIIDQKEVERKVIERKTESLKYLLQIINDLKTMISNSDKYNSFVKQRKYDERYAILVILKRTLILEKKLEILNQKFRNSFTSLDSRKPRNSHIKIPSYNMDLINIILRIESFHSFIKNFNMRFTSSDSPFSFTIGDQSYLDYVNNLDQTIIFPDIGLEEKTIKSMILDLESEIKVLNNFLESSDTPSLILKIQNKEESHQITN